MSQTVTLSDLHCAMLAGCIDSAEVRHAWGLAMLEEPIHAHQPAACDRCNDELSDGNPGICANCVAGTESASAARIEQLETALRNAREALDDWGLYISDDMRQRHGFASDLAEIDAALADPDNLQPAGSVTLTGRLISIGNLPECDAPEIIGRPHILLRVPGHDEHGRTLLVSVLLACELLDLVPLLERQASIRIGA